MADPKLPEDILGLEYDWIASDLEFIKPGRPMQNGFIERFNRSYREVVLDMFVFQSYWKCASKQNNG